MRILNFGSLNLDQVYAVEHMVRPGETLSSLRHETNLGGKGLNQSVALKRAGCQVWHAGQIGQDGQALREALEKEGVHTEELRTAACPTGHAIIQVDAQGQNCILLFGGANQSIPTTMMDDVLSRFAPGDVLVCQNEINDMEHLTAAAAARGMRIALNPSPMNQRMTPVILRRCEWVFLNETEGAAISGCDASAPEQMMDALCAAYPAQHFILTLGAAGALCGQGEYRLRGRSCQVEAVDTTAAGDTFTGYYLAQMLLDGDEAEALRLAATASALAVTRPGASPSIPRRQEVLSARLPWRT